MAHVPDWNPLPSGDNLALTVRRLNARMTTLVDGLRALEASLEAARAVADQALALALSRNPLRVQRWRFSAEDTLFLEDEDSVVSVANGTGAQGTIQLPALTRENRDREYLIHAWDCSVASPLVVLPAGENTINGHPGITLTSDYEWVTLKGDRTTNPSTWICTAGSGPVRYTSNLILHTGDNWVLHTGDNLITH